MITALDHIAIAVPDLEEEDVGDDAQEVRRSEDLLDPGQRAA